jgi:alpha-galactosidase
MNTTTLLVTSSVLIMGTMAAKFDDLAMAPPMGWNSWNLFKKDITEKDVIEMAEELVNTGMAEAGYEYIVLDTGWRSEHYERPRLLLADQRRFPRGMRFLADYIHAKGLRFGIYASPDATERMETPVNSSQEFFDARIYSHWDLDYLKYDWYYLPENEERSLYALKQQALYAVARPVIFSFHERDTSTGKDDEDPYPQWQPGNAIDSWDAMMEVFDRQKKIVQRTGPGHWNDPGMLDVGNGNMTTEEYRTHFSLWCMLAAPLMTGNDLRNMSKETLSILTNREMVSIDQDTSGLHAFCFCNEDDYEIWIKPLESNGKAACLLNRSNRPRTVEVIASLLLRATACGTPDDYLPENYIIRDVWRHEDLHEGDIFCVVVPPHGVVVLKFVRKDLRREEELWMEEEQDRLEERKRKGRERE